MASFTSRIRNFIRNIILTPEEKKFQETIKSLKELKNKPPQVKKAVQYVTTIGGDKKVKEELPKQSYRNLRVLYSEAPGAIQCGNVLNSKILGGGFIIKPVDSEKEIDESNEQYQILARFLADPNKDETLEDIFSVFYENYLVYGNAYLEKVFIKKEGVPIINEIYNLDTEKIKILVDPKEKKRGNELAVGYTRSIEGSSKRIKYNLENVVHLKRPSKRGGVYGEAILENQSGIISMAISAIIYNNRKFKNQGSGRLKIKLPVGTTKEDAELFKQYYDNNYTGEANAGKDLILYGGADADELGSGNRDVEFVSANDRCERAICGAFTVPLVAISNPEGSNRATSIEEMKGFHINKIIPERTKILKKFNREIVFQGLGITEYKLDIKELDTEDQGKLTKEAKEAMESGLASPNEAMEYSGWETVDEEWANKKWRFHTVKGNPIERMEDDVQAEQDRKQQTADRFVNQPKGQNDTSNDKDKDKKKKEDEKDKAKEKERKKKEEEREKQQKTIKDFKKEIKNVIELNELRQTINSHLYYGKDEFTKNKQTILGTKK